MKDVKCAYCVEGELLDAFGIKICELKHSTLILFKEQSHKGRVIVASRSHVSEIVDMEEEERLGFLHDVNRVAKALHAAFSPEKINYGAYGDTGSHTHFHLVPKYKDDFEWGSVFAMNPGRKYLNLEEYEEIIERIKENL
ncbi:MAG: HIT family protein [Vallitaleaceae bacterium]|nr:HIT family protein [Vallitaleaceae bacterium]